MKRSNTYLLSVILLLSGMPLIGQSVFGQLVAEPLNVNRPDTTWNPVAISGDGSTIVGSWKKEGATDLRGARWTPGGGLEDLGTFPGEFSTQKMTAFSGVSADGSIAVGQFRLDGVFHAVAWGQTTGLVDLTETYSVEAGTASLVSDNGNLIAGSRNAGSFRFDWETGGVEYIEGMRASGMSADGTKMVGGWTDDIAYLWEAGQLTDLGFLPGGDYAGVTGISADGSTLVGRARNASGEDETVYWKGSNMTPLGEETDGAIAVSSDGNVILGTFDDRSYFLWTLGVVTPFEDVLDADTCTPGWTVIEILGMADDGRTFLVRAGNPEGEFDWWRMQLSQSAGKSPPECGCAEWASAGGGAFTEEANWDSAGPPSDDTCALFDVGGTYAVDFSEDASTGSLFVGDDLLTFDLNNHTYTVKTSLLDTGGAAPEPALGIADTGENGTLILSEGTLLVENGFVVVGDNGGNGKLVVSENGRLEAAEGSGVYFELAGDAGSSGGLLVEAGGQLSTPFTNKVAQAAGATAAIEVKGAGSKWIGAQTTLAESGAAELLVREGGSVDLIALKTASESEGAADLLVRDPGSVLGIKEGGFIIVGEAGQATLRLEAQGRIEQDSSTVVVLGLEPGSAGRAELTSGAAWEQVGLFRVGVEGLGEVEIDGGASLHVKSLEIAGEQAGAGTLFNHVKVSGAASKLVQQGDADSWIGRLGTGLLRLEQGAQLSMEGNLVVGGFPEEGVPVSEHLGELEVVGAGTQAVVGGSMAIGARFKGTALISEGAKLEAHDVWVGFVPGSAPVMNTLTVTGAGSTLESVWLLVGGAHGELAIVNGALVTADSMYVGVIDEVPGEVVVGGSTATLIASELHVGALEGTQGSLDIQEGGLVFAGLLDVGSGGTVNGTIIQMGTGGGNKQKVAEGLVVDSLMVASGARVSFGTMTMGAAAVLGYRLDGRGTEEERVEIAGAIELDGTLTVDVEPGYAPAVGETYTVVQAEAVEGEFEKIDTAPGLEVEVGYHDAAVTVSVLSYTLLPVANEEAAVQPLGYRLHQNYPNPFNPQTVIGYETTEPGHVRLAVYDALGRTVAWLVDGVQAAGVYEVAFEADDLPGGVYFYRLEAGAYTATRRMVLLR